MRMELNCITRRVHDARRTTRMKNYRKTKRQDDRGDLKDGRKYGSKVRIGEERSSKITQIRWSKEQMERLKEKNKNSPLPIRLRLFSSSLNNDVIKYDVHH